MTVEPIVERHDLVDPPFAGIAFDHVVSLGGDCETAHHLRRLGRLKRTVFDWLVTPLDAIPRILAEDGRRLGHEFVVVHGGTSVRCGIYDVLYHHEFPRGDGDAVRFDAVTLEGCRSKMAHKWARLVETCQDGGRVLFVRFEIGTTLAWDDLREEPWRAAERLAACADAIARRFPGLDFRILVLVTDGPDPSIADPRIVVRHVPRDGVGGWAVGDATWDAIMETLDVRTPLVERTLGETLHWSGETDDPAMVMSVSVDGPVETSRPTIGVAAASGEWSSAIRAGLAAAARLRAASGAAQTDRDASARVARECVADPLLAPPLRQAAAAVMLACGQLDDALATLQEAKRIAPELPAIDSEIAAILTDLGRQGEALAHLRGAAAAEPTRPRVLRRLAMLEATHGDGDLCLDVLGSALASGVEPATFAVDVGRTLWAVQRSHHAARAFDLAFASGVREATFLRDHLDLLTGEARYADVLAAAAAIGPFDDGLISRRHMRTGHARLALAYDRAAEIAEAELLEASPEWFGADALLGLVRSHLEDARPFSLIRVGDGEARFLLAARPDLRPEVGEREAHVIGDVVWENWFGEKLASIGADTLADLATDYAAAIAGADVIGVSDAMRLRQDTGHYGYLAFQNRWLRDVAAKRDGVLWTSAFAHREMERASPSLAALLDGLDALGVISPHPGLARLLAERFAIADTFEIVIPAEGRLATAAQTRTLGRHFPEIYQDVLATLRLPRPGCLVLVAGGLLGKVYCDRVRAIGGVALDIGALADAWMGHDTRDGQFAHVQNLAC